MVVGRWGSYAPLGVLSCLVLMGCPPPHGDDDDTPTPAASETEAPTHVIATLPPDTPTAEVTPTPGPVTVAGRIRAIDPETGLDIDDERYRQCYGSLVISFLEDPGDVQNPIRKITLRSPDEYATVFAPNRGNLFISVVADINNDKLIGFYDLYREYTRNPLFIGVRDHLGVDIVMDLPECGTGFGGGGCCGGGGGGGGGGGSTEYATFSGRTELGDPEIESAPVAVTANDLSFRGPYVVDTAGAPGPFAINVPTSALAETNLLAYLDSDGNGLFEPSDHLAEAPRNPYPLMEDPTRDIVITFEPNTFEFDEPPLPVYVPISGQVIFDGEHEGLIFTFISESRPRGPIVSEGAQPEQGGFLLRAPQNTEDLWLWGVVDENGDGLADPATEAWGKTGPIRTTSAGVSGLSLTLGLEPPPTPSPEPTQAPEATEPDETEPEAATAIPTLAPTEAPTEAPQVTPTATLDPAMARVAGTIEFSGAYSSSDVIRVTVQGINPAPGETFPTRVISLDGLSFPLEYHFNSIDPGTYQILAFLDRGADNAEQPGDEDATGWYAELEGGPAQVDLLAGQTMDGADITLRD